MTKVLTLIHQPTGKKCALFIVAEGKLKLAHSREMEPTFQFYCDDLSREVRDIFADEFAFEIRDEYTSQPHSAQIVSGRRGNA